MSSPTNLEDVEPEEAQDENSFATKKTTSSRRSLSKLRRELSDEDLASPAVNKLLLDEIERLEREASEVATLRIDFHEADKKASVCAQKLNVVRSIEVIHAACIAVGGAILGYAPSLPSSFFIALCGCVLIAAGVFAKAIKL